MQVLQQRELEWAELESTRQAVLFDLLLAGGLNIYFDS